MTTFGFILGEVFRRVTGRTIGQYLRTEIAEPLGAEVHIGLSRAEQRRCAELVEQAAHPPDAGRRQRPRLPHHAGRTPEGRIGRRRWGLRRTTKSAPTTLSCGARSSSRAPTAQVSALGLATFYNALAQEQAAQPSAHGPDPGVAGRLRHRSGARPAGRRPRVGSGLHAQPALCRTDPTRGSSATAVWAARSGSSTSNTGSATRT